MVDYSRFAHIDDSSSDDDDVAMEHVKHVAREVLGRPGGPQQNIDEMLESFRAGEARRRPEDHPLLPPPRFDVGARVMCCVEEDEEMWLTGTVIRHWAQQEGMVCPYVVQVDEDRGEIWVHEDSESAIRALETCHIVKRRPPASLSKALLEGIGDGVARDLITACAAGDLKEVKRLVEMDVPASIDIKDEYPLLDEACPVSKCVALKNDQLDVWGTAFLASLKSEKIERSALSGAFAGGAKRTQGKLPVVHELIKAAAAKGYTTLGATKGRDGRRALLWAADAANDEEAAALVAAVRAAGARDLDADVALARASTRGRGALVAALLADWSANRSVAPALHRAADAGHAEIVKALLARARDVDAETARGSTALALALDKGRLDCVRALLEAGADPLRDKTRLSLRVAGVDVETARAYVGALTTLAITRPEDVAAELAACVAAAPSSAVARILREGERALAPVLAEPADDGLAGLSVKALKALAAERGVDISRCCEKSEIVALLRAAPAPPPPPPAPTPEPAAPPANATSKKNAKKRRKKRASAARQAAAAAAAALENADASLAHFDELAAAIDDEGEAEPLDEIELAAVAAAEEGIGAKTLRRGLAAVQAAEEAGVDAVARARELEAVLSEFAQPDVETVSLDANDDDATTDDTDADGADPAVRALLTRLDLVRFLDTFRENEVDAASLPKLTSADLAEMRIPIGPRRLILDALAETDASRRPRRKSAGRRGRVIVS